MERRHLPQVAEGGPYLEEVVTFPEPPPVVEDVKWPVLRVSVWGREPAQEPPVPVSQVYVRQPPRQHPHVEEDVPEVAGVEE